MDATGVAGSRSAVCIGCAGLMFFAACGGRTALELGDSTRTRPNPGAASSGAGGRASGAGGHASGAGGLVAPDPRRTPPTACTADGWCGALGDYAAIWGSSLSDIWVAANHVKNGNPAQINAPETPVLLHWDGREWSTTELLDASLVKLTSIWGSSSEDVWVVGTGA